MRELARKVVCLKARSLFSNENEHRRSVENRISEFHVRYCTMSSVTFFKFISSA